jgi:hypothetical protein
MRSAYGMMLRLRYRVLKLRALCWVLRRLRAAKQRPSGTDAGRRVPHEGTGPSQTPRENTHAVAASHA